VGLGLAGEVGEPERAQAVLLAQDTAIQAKYPQLLIVDSPPTGMDEAELARIRETPLWLDEDPPQGLLRAWWPTASAKRYALTCR
jgi:hypothetical protein